MGFFLIFSSFSSYHPLDLGLEEKKWSIKTPKIQPQPYLENNKDSLSGQELLKKIVRKETTLCEEFFVTCYRCGSLTLARRGVNIRIFSHLADFLLFRLNDVVDLFDALLGGRVDEVRTVQGLVLADGLVLFELLNRGDLVAANVSNARLALFAELAALFYFYLFF